MALNVGQDFKKRWLDAPNAVHQSFFDDLNRICDLLQPITNIEKWMDNDRRALQVAQLQVDQAYTDLKAQLIEEARVRKQLALEKSLADKRAKQHAYNLQLQQDELQRFYAQTQSLNALQKVIDDEIEQQSQRYSKNPEYPAIDFSNSRSRIADDQMLSELESVRLRLELEAEVSIEDAVNAFRLKLQAAAKEEIDYMLANSKFSAEI